jgi:hypothetical protein
MVNYKLKYYGYLELPNDDKYLLNSYNCYKNIPDVDEIVYELPISKIQKEQVAIIKLIANERNISHRGFSAMKIKKYLGNNINKKEATKEFVKNKYKIDVNQHISDAIMIGFVDSEEKNGNTECQR